ncbi:histidinol dehydrogenase [candidate division MSBL1 archaeon SCGC-AAA385D11]|uniref:Histidinol dehydrogenase n=1 Tax=candidate division MSBL1 archaeon SCGC-AAA385D11 TaxID=1698286 RepID=A0A133VNH8_9EURY|nr:histidinol dehydrogenase [candidate division MSBL1 archaeon SCGC-AAA385D11]
METSPLEIVRLWKRPDRYYLRLLRRSEGEVTGVLPKVRKIVSHVREKGDLALLDYTKKFDGIDLTRDQLCVSKSELEGAYGELESESIKALEKAAETIKRYHRRQLPEEWMEEFESGVYAGEIVRPLDSVGIYAPGGIARYPSSVLMSVIPARVAGVRRIVVCTPPDSEGRIDDTVMAAAVIAEADEVYRVGGAQAIAAMAYGTRTIPKMDKIVGPGGIYVQAAKKVVSSNTNIDFVAGPSEVLVLADSFANPRLIALDLVAQAEHDPSSAAVLATSSKKLAEKVQKEVASLIDETPRRRIVLESIQKYGRIVVARSLKRATEFANDYAPEHLELMVKRPKKVLDQIKNAGAVFIGPYSPIAAGDFAVGPSHVLPTGGASRWSSGLSVMSFLRTPSVQKATKDGLKRLSEVVEKLAELEGLPAHARSVRERLD